MKCQNCYWYNPEADGSGCIQGHETPEGCPDFYEDWELLAEVSPSDSRLHGRTDEAARILSELPEFTDVDTVAIFIPNRRTT